jgi:hypothetical protein
MNQGPSSSSSSSGGGGGGGGGGGAQAASDEGRRAIQSINQSINRPAECVNVGMVEGE